MTQKRQPGKLGKQGFFFLLFLFLANLTTSAQTEITVTGKVRSDSSALEGVTITVKANPGRVAVSGPGGVYSIKAPANGILVFTSVGYQTLEQPIEGNDKIDVKMTTDFQAMDNVVVSVGFGTQKKTSLVSSITSVDPKELKGPTSNLTNMLAGRVSGVIAYQRSGEPGSDNASFFIRGLGSFGAGKVDPLILIDGIESTNNDLARLQPDDIASFSVLKDATAAAVYGARGANGVLIITTKTGKAGATSFTGRFENSLSTNTRNFQLTDNITYMNMANQAALTRNSPGGAPYSQTKINRTTAGDNPLLYPNNNWIDMLIDDYTINQRFNFGVSGGSEKARYYIAGTYNVDNGLLKENKLNGFSNNIQLKNYSVRSNIDLKVTNTTSAALRMYGQFDDYNGPIGDRRSDGTMGSGGQRVFNQAIWSNPVMFPAIYPQAYLPHIKHPLFGNSTIPGLSTPTMYSNPYANMMSGFAQSNASTLQVQVELKQDMGAITPGLSGRVMTYTRRYGYFDMQRSYTPFYYKAVSYDDRNIDALNVLNGGGQNTINPVGTEFLGYSEGYKMVNSIFYTEAALNYNRTLNDVHELSGMVIGTMRNYLTGNASTLEASLPARNLGVSGRFTYGYDRRYLAEFDFGYNGSEKFDKASSRFGFFPSIGLAWNVSNEKFFDRFADKVTNLKLRGTYGLVGNDQIGNANDRFFYMSMVNMNAGGYTFGLDYNFNPGGIAVQRYANPEITWEKTKQLNVGMDLTIMNALTFTVDAYKNKRSQILMPRSYIPSTMGLQAGVSANVGKTEVKGVDLLLNYNKTINKKVWVEGRANLTYATGKITMYDEPDYGDALSNLYRQGSRIGQVYGYIAERLFYDEKEVLNTPRTPYENVMGGDIKYHDVDGDGRITSNDVVPIGLPTTPEVIYGFGGSAGYGNFDFSIMFQGSARSSFFINPQNISPFVRNGGSQNGLLTAIAENHWSEDNRNSYAFWPRLSNQFIDNNNLTSTWWMRDGSFLRLKNMEFGYSIPTRLLNKIKFKTTRIYINGSNLHVWSAFDMWDPEMGGNGLGYPVQRVFNAGINFNL